MNIKDLPAPECKYGYTQDQLKSILKDRFNDFCDYSIGSTGTICNGQEYNRDTDKHDLTNCGPHGLVTYKCDVETFLEGRPTFD